MTTAAKAPPPDKRFKVDVAFSNIEIGRLHASKNNPRLDFNKAKLQELADSIKDVGILEPLLVRHHPEQTPVGSATRAKEGSHFEVLAGHRRLRAAALAGLTELPCIVRDVDDQVALEIMVTENLQRENLHPLEEANGLRLLEKAGWSNLEIAKHLGKSQTWIACRKALSNLTPKWKKAIEDPKLTVHSWPLSVMETVARYGADVQDSLYEHFDFALDSDYADDWPSVEMIRDQASEHCRTLDDAPWDKGDMTLVPKAGSCNQCDLRASCRKDLFSELKIGDGVGKVPKGDTCLNGECFDSKRKAYAKLSFQKARTSNPGLVMVAQQPDFFGCSDAHLYSPCKEGDKNAERIYVVETGKVFWATTAKLKGKTAGGGGIVDLAPSEKAAIAAPLTAVEKARALVARRDAHICQAVQKLLEKQSKRPKTKLCCIGRMCAIAVVFGTAHRWDRGPGLYGSTPNVGGKSCGDPWAEIARLGPLEGEGMKQPDVDALADQLWYQIRPVLLGRLTFYSNQQVDVEGIVRVAELLALNLFVLQAEAISEIPVPKSWGPPERKALKARYDKRAAELSWPAPADEQAELAGKKPKGGRVNPKPAQPSSDAAARKFESMPKLSPVELGQIAEGTAWDACTPLGDVALLFTVNCPEEGMLTVRIWGPNGNSVFYDYEHGEFQRNYRLIGQITEATAATLANKRLGSGGNIRLAAFVASRLKKELTPEVKKAAEKEMAAKLLKAVKGRKQPKLAGPPLKPPAGSIGPSGPALATPESKADHAEARAFSGNLPGGIGKITHGPKRRSPLTPTEEQALEDEAGSLEVHRDPLPGDLPPELEAKLASKTPLTKQEGDQLIHALHQPAKPAKPKPPEVPKKVQKAAIHNSHNSQFVLWLKSPLLCERDVPKHWKLYARWPASSLEKGVTYYGYDELARQILMHVQEVKRGTAGVQSIDAMIETFSGEQGVGPRTSTLVTLLTAAYEDGYRLHGQLNQGDSETAARAMVDRAIDGRDAGKARQ